MGVVALVESFLILFVRLRHRRQLQRWQRCELTNVVRSDLIGRDPDVDLPAMVRIGQLRREPCRQLQSVRRSVERLDRHTRDALHHQALINDGAQRFERWRRFRQEGLRTLGPELIHHHAMRHIHEPKPNRRLGFVRRSCLGPAHRVEQRQSQRSSEPLQTSATVNDVFASHGKIS